MTYSAIGLLAIMILLIENQDIILQKRSGFEMPAWRVYRRFLITILVYDVTDVIWGILNSMKLAKLLFIDTSVYFAAMAVGVLFWTQYIVAYLDEDSVFSRVVKVSGQIFSAAAVLLAAVNCFAPVLFSVSDDCVYTALTGRYIVLAFQIALLLLISAYALSAMARGGSSEKNARYRTLALFGVIMAVFLLGQLRYPLLPLYAVACLLGTCLLRAFVIGDEKEEYRTKMEEAARKSAIRESVTSLIDNMPCLCFSKDAETGIYLACNQSFAEYAHKADPSGVVGLTDALIFDPVTAAHFVEDDRMALSMDDPYVFYEDVPDAAGNPRQFQTTKLAYRDETGRLCTLGMCQDVTDLVRVQRENATTKEAYDRARRTGIIYSHIAQTLTSGYRMLFYVNTETGEFIQYSTESEGDTLVEARRGDNFFASCIYESEMYVHQDDREAFRNAMNKKALEAVLDKGRHYVMTYRMLGGSGDGYVSMKVSRMVDDKRFIVIGVTDIDDQIRQRRAAERAEEERIAYSRINALAGDFICIYIDDPDTGWYREYSTTKGFESILLPKEGRGFFAVARERAKETVYQDDLERFQSLFTKEGVLSEIKRTGIFAMSYRMVVDGKPIYVRLKAAMVEEKEGSRLVVGINDIDSHVRQEEQYEKRLAQAVSKANIDALTGVRNKHAYLEKEGQLDRQIREHRQPEFALVIMDVNDLKRVNDTRGHQAGDEYLLEATRVICRVFKYSPVFRIGGDEFAVFVQGNDYESIEELMGRMTDHNTLAMKNGGIVIACGVSKYDRDPDVASVFRRADQYMYENKQNLKLGDKNNR